MPRPRDENDRFLTKISATIEVGYDELGSGKQSSPWLRHASAPADGLSRQPGEYVDDDFFWKVRVASHLQLLTLTDRKVGRKSGGFPARWVTGFDKNQ